MLLPGFRVHPSPSMPDVPFGYMVRLSVGTLEGAQVFRAHVQELPDVTEYAATAQEAFDLAVDAIRTTARILAERGSPMPSPVNAAIP